MRWRWCVGLLSCSGMLSCSGAASSADVQTGNEVAQRSEQTSAVQAPDEPARPSAATEPARPSAATETERVPSPCSQAASSAVLRALRAGRDDGQALEGCVPADAVCAGTQAVPPPPAELTGCAIFVNSHAQRHEVRVFPAPTDGAADRYEAWISEDGAEVGRTELSANRWAVGRTGQVRIVGLTQRRSHTHGGDPASVSSAVFAVVNETGGPLVARATGVRWLSSSSCDGPLELRAELVPTGLTVAEGPSSSEVTVPPGASEVRVSFPRQEAYYTHCDRFAAEVTLRVGADSLVAAQEWRIIRREPLR